MSSPEFRWFYAGTAALALVIGSLIGVSASPVVGVTVPLLFALLSAGGAIYVVMGKDDATPPLDSRDAGQTQAPARPSSPLSSYQRRGRAGFLGKQLVAFAVGVLPGIWLGAGAKLHSETVWGQRSVPEAAIIDLNFTDARDLAATMALDERLMGQRVGLVARKRLLTALHDAVNKRRNSDTLALAADDAAAADSVLKSLQREAKPPGEKKADEKKEEFGPVALGPDTSNEKTT
jgi:hypothetical protein